MRAALLLLLMAGAVHAAPVAVATSHDGATLTLHDEAGPCVGGARLAVWRGVDGQIVPGCWVIARAHIRIAYLDGDVDAIEPTVFRKPTSL
jgi:hypothetical protein